MGSYTEVLECSIASHNVTPMEGVACAEEAWIIAEEGRALAMLE